jgi:hypothetical protein
MATYEETTIRRAVECLTRVADAMDASELCMEVLASRNQLRELITHTDAEARRILMEAGISPAF